MKVRVDRRRGIVTEPTGNGFHVDGNVTVTGGFESSAFDGVTSLYVDPINGNDNNRGTAASPIQTNVEVTRRFKHTKIVTSALNVVYTSYPPQSDPMRLDINVGQVSPTAAPFITFTAPALTTKKSGNVLATVARSRSLNRPNAITGTGLDSTDVDLRLRVTSGARVGARAWVAKSTGTNNVRLSEPCIPDLVNLALTPVVLSSAAGGDPFVIERATGIMYVDYINVYGTFGVLPAQPTVQFVDFDFQAYKDGTAGVGLFADGCTLSLSNCKLQSGSWMMNNRMGDGFAFTYLQNCSAYSKAVIIFGGDADIVPNAFVDAGLYTLVEVTNGGQTEFDSDVLFQGASGGQVGSLASAFGGIAVIDSVGVMDTTALGKGSFLCGVGGQIVFSEHTFYANGGFGWGSSSVGSAWGGDIQDNANLMYATASRITVTGPGSNNFRLGGGSLGYSFDPSSHAYTTGVATLWTNLPISNNNLHDPVHNAHVFSLTGMNF